MGHQREKKNKKEHHKNKRNHSPITTEIFYLNFTKENKTKSLLKFYLIIINDELTKHLIGTSVKYFSKSGSEQK